jgi:uncharacterized protein (TIGR02391 family)
MGLVKQYFPPAEALLQMDAEGVAGYLLNCLCELEGMERWSDGKRDYSAFQLLNRSHFIQPAHYEDYATPEQQDDVGVALSEAWSWLERHGLIVPLPEATNYVVVTKAGKRLSGRGDPRALFAIAMLQPGQLDEALDARVRPAFLKGDYSDAVFQAFKRVEVVVRDLAGLDDSYYGKDLMRTAFDPQRGPLADQQQLDGEREGITHLFAGATQAFKNPGSHRDPDFDDPIQVAELILLADLLIRIARRHAAVATAQAPGS